ncbi:hypothetical protein B0H65DRAFT_290681 [Neurospora tetraspora]|uniref:Secreted protein n=1 Tax=Neurospora tetraspora TaxID=94610 RepID=A0AAE0J8T6_9PEZI|nr:hypothetical protein B0H65DRAFT_290681 [Neurospora tetraspora]
MGAIMATCLCHVLFGFIEGAVEGFRCSHLCEVDDSQHWQPLSRTSFSGTVEIGDGKVTGNTSHFLTLALKFGLCHPVCYMTLVEVDALALFHR